MAKSRENLGRRNRLNSNFVAPQGCQRFLTPKPLMDLILRSLPNDFIISSFIQKIGDWSLALSQPDKMMEIIPINRQVFY